MTSIISDMLRLALIDLHLESSDCDFVDGEQGGTIVVKDGEGKALYSVVPSSNDQRSLVLDKDNKIVIDSNLWTDVVRYVNGQRDA